MTSRIARQRSHVYSALAAIGFAATSGAWLTMGNTRHVNIVNEHKIEDIT